MTKNKPIIENFLSWKSLPTLITFIGILLAIVFTWTNLTERVGAIERDHVTFGEQYRRDLMDIKQSQEKTQADVHELYLLFIKK